MHSSLNDFQIVTLIEADEYGLLFRGRLSAVQSSTKAVDEVLIRQWTSRSLFNTECKDRLEKYYQLEQSIDKDLSRLARVLSWDFNSGRCIFEPFWGTVRNHALFLESVSPVWQRLWRDVCAGLMQLHMNDLNHGNLNADSILIKRDGTVKLSCIFPAWQAPSTSVPGVPVTMTGAGGLLERDIYQICSTLLSSDFTENLPAEDIEDLRKLQAGQMTLYQANERVNKRYQDYLTAQQQKEDQQLYQASIVREIHRRRRRHKRSSVFWFSGLIVTAILVLIAGKMTIDHLYDTDLRNIDHKDSRINREEFNHAISSESDKSHLISIQQQLNKKQIPENLLSPPSLSEEPELGLFVGKITSVRTPEIKILNANMLRTITIVVDDQTTKEFADGTPISMELLKPGKEVEVQYEKNSRGDGSDGEGSDLPAVGEKVYARIVKIREF